MTYADKMHRFAQETRQEEHDRSSRYMKGFRAFAANVKSKPKEQPEPRISAAEMADVLTEFRDSIKPPEELTAAIAAHEAAQKNQTSGFLATLARACGIRPKK